MKLKYLRKLICSFVVVIFIMMVLCSISAFAAPETLSPDTYSTKIGQITLKVPEKAVTTTTNERLTVAATAPQGTVVTVYRYDSASGIYKKCYINSTPVEAVVGPTMLFAGQVDLSPGVNKFIIRGEATDGSATISRFDVNMLSKGFMERIKSIIEFNF